MSLLKRYPFWMHYFWTYFIPLGFVIMMIYAPGPLYALHGGSFKFLPLLQETIAKSGVELRGGALIPLLRSLNGESVLLIAALLSATPAVVALVLAPLTYGKKGLITLIGRLRPWLDDRPLLDGLKVWGLAFLVLIGTQLLTFFIRKLTGAGGDAGVQWNDRLFSLAVIWLILEAAFLNQGGLLEELGFRGYALPLLQERMSPLKATLLLGVCWALWHIPRDIAFEMISGLGMTTYLFVYLPLFMLWCIGGSLMMTYFVNRTGGSALIAIAIHGLLNDSASISGLHSGDSLIAAMLPRTFAVVVVALGILWVAGPTLGREMRGRGFPPADGAP